MPSRTLRINRFVCIIYPEISKSGEILRMPFLVIESYLVGSRGVPPIGRLRVLTGQVLMPQRARQTVHCIRSPEPIRDNTLDRRLIEGEEQPLAPSIADSDDLAAQLPHRGRWPKTKVRLKFTLQLASL